jgi:hypothetical protein
MAEVRSAEGNKLNKCEGNDTKATRVNGTRENVTNIQWRME